MASALFNIHPKIIEEWHFESACTLKTRTTNLLNHLFDEIDTLHRDYLPLISKNLGAALFENAIAILD